MTITWSAFIVRLQVNALSLLKNPVGMVPWQPPETGFAAEEDRIVNWTLAPLQKLPSVERASSRREERVAALILEGALLTVK